jgi:outer membrane protein assembly factor BamB
MPESFIGSSRGWKLRWWRAAVIVAGVSLPALGQVGDGLQPAELLPSDAKESLQNVTVNDSTEARRDIATARGMERLKEWNKAAGWYQEVLTKYHARVIPWKADSHNVINSYRGIVYQVQESLAKWPEDGVKAYRARYESAAAAMVEAAGPQDAGALQAVLDSYFITEAGKIAGMKLIDLHMESGDFDAAARVGGLLLDWYPADHLIAERPRLLYRTAVAQHLCGNEKAAASRAAELKQKFADAAGSIYGKDVVLSQSLEKLLLAKAAIARHLSPDSWMTFSGSPDRAQISTAQGNMGARLFSVELPARASSKGPDATGLKQRSQMEEAEGRTIGIMPVVDGGSLFFQDGARIWAVGLDSGIPLPGWVQTHGSKGFYQLKSSATLRNQQYTLTLTENSVLGVLGQSTRLQMYYAAQGQELPGGADAGTRLVCLDRETGRERWKILSATLGGDNLQDEEKERLRSLDFSGSPLVVGDSVYIIGRGGKDLQFENCYLLCFDLATGQYRWSCFVASSNTASNFGGDPSQGGLTLSHLSYEGGRVYLLTNLGALASIDAAKGSIVWLSLYPRDGMFNNEDPNVQLNFRFRRPRAVPTLNLRPWENNPVFTQDGKLFFMPTDGKFLLVYDASSGQELKRISVEDFQEDNISDRPNALVAIVGEWIILQGQEHVYGVRWQKYDSDKTFVANDAALNIWKNHLMGAGDQSLPSSGSIRGRAFVTFDSVYVATTRFLLRLSFKGALKVADKYPSSRDTWDDKEGPGNVVITNEYVIVAGKSSVDVYTDMSLARAKLDREIAAAPDDAAVRLHYAEVMLAAGQADVSLAKLMDAAVRLGGVDALRSGPLRQRLFNDAIKFAEKLAREQEAPAVESAIRFYDLAGKAAELPSEQVNYRLSRARFVRTNVVADSYPTAVRLYQEIISRPELRTVSVVPENETQAEARGVVQAAAEAEGQIADVIREHPEAYEAVAKEATAAMEAANAGGDPLKLLEIAQDYPNASVASKAILLAANLYEKQKNPRLATHVLRQVYRKYGDTSDKDQIIEAMARNYLNLPGGFDIAIARLDREKRFGDTKLTQPLLLPDGTKIEDVTFREAARQLAQARPAEASAPAPDVHVPFFHKPTEAEKAAGKKHMPPFYPATDGAHSPVIPNITQLVRPPAEMPDALRSDRVVAATGKQLHLFDPGTTKPRGSSDALSEDPRAAVWIHDPAHRSALLAWSGKEIVLLNGDTAASLWKTPLTALPPSELVTVAGMRNAEVAVDNVPGDANAADEQPVFINGRGRRMQMGRRNAMMRVNIAAQVQLQAAQAELEASAAGGEQIWHVRPLEDRVVLGTSTGRLYCVESTTGKLLWQTRVSPKPIQRLVASEDFTAVIATEDGVARIIVVDNYNGQIQMMRQFGDANLMPINMAISPDGMLVWTLADRLCGKDLYEPDTKKLTFEFPPSPAPAAGGANGGINAIYFGCSEAGQLMIQGRKILAMEQYGRFVSVHSLDDGKPLKHQSGQDEAMTLLTTGAQGSTAQITTVTTQMRLIGRCMYVYGAKSLLGYHLDHPGLRSWTPQVQDTVPANFKAAIPTKDFIMMVGEPGIRKVLENPARIFQLRFYTPILVLDASNTSGGRIEQIYDIAEGAGISAWQAVDGGVYYLSNDQKLHFLRGTRE